MEKPFQSPGQGLGGGGAAGEAGKADRGAIQGAVGGAANRVAGGATQNQTPNSGSKIIAAAVVVFILAAGAVSFYLYKNSAAMEEASQKIASLGDEIKKVSENIDKIGVQNSAKNTTVGAAKNNAVKNGAAKDSAVKPIQDATQGDIQNNFTAQNQLKVVGDHLEGRTEALGYLVVRQEESFDDNSFNVAYFAVMSGEKALVDWITGMSKSGNTINQLGKYPLLGLGCDTGSKIDGTWTQITGAHYTALKTSSEKKSVKAAINFSDPPDIGGPCLTFIKSLAVNK